MNQAPSPGRLRDSVRQDGSAEALVSRAADEFLAQIERGERLDLEQFVAGYPQIAGVLRQVLPALQVIRQSSPGSLAVTGPAGAPPPAGEETGCLGDFRLLREVGRGGMGIVYEAEQISLGRRVALKILPFAAALDLKQLQRFKNEATAAASIHHTNIVPVYQVGTERGVHYYAMQFIDGKTLADVILELRDTQDALSVESKKPGQSPSAAGRPSDSTRAHGALTTKTGTKRGEFFRTAAQLGIQAAEALEHAHQIGIVHRDIKPGNLLVGNGGLDSLCPRLWVTDFGLAQIGTDTRLTMSGDLLGTLRYMSPEQALAKRVVVDHRTDIYSLGATLYELLTLEPAFGGADRQELLRQIAFEEAKPLRRLNSSIPAELETIVLKAIAKNPDERYATAQQVADDLRRFLEDRPIQARRPTIWQRSRKWARRHKPVVWSAIISAGVLLVMAVVALAISNVLISREEKQKAKALDRARRSEREARRAVDEWYIQMSEGNLLNHPTLEASRKQLLQKAVRYYEQFVREHGEDPELQAELVAACFRITNMIYALGEEEDWLTPFEKGVAVMEELMRKNPDAAALGSLRAGIFRPMATYMPTPKPVEALLALEKARDLWEPLVRAHPTVPGFQNDLAYFYGMIGFVHMRCQRHTEAARAYRTARDLARQVAETNPGTPHHRVLLAMALALLQGELAELGLASEADEADRKAVMAVQKLVADYPEVPYYLELLAWTWDCLGTGRRGLGQLEKEEEAWRQVVAADEKLAQDFPTVARYRNDQLWTQATLAELLWSTGRRDKAADLFRQVLDRAERVGPEDAFCCDLRAWILATCPDLQFRDPRRAVELAKKSTARAPKGRGYWTTLGAAHYRAGGWQDAVEALNKAVELPGDSGGWECFLLAMAHTQLGHKDQARQWYDKAIQWMEKNHWNNRELSTLRAEAEQVLGINKQP